MSPTLKRVLSRNYQPKNTATSLNEKNLIKGSFKLQDVIRKDSERESNAPHLSKRLTLNNLSKQLLPIASGGKPTQPQISLPQDDFVQSSEEKPDPKQSDDFSMNMGTILSETNEVNKYLQKDAVTQYASPSIGRISCAMPEFTIRKQNLQKSSSSDEENILEITMGKTLTQQKQILQEISQTSKRQRNLSSIEIVQSINAENNQKELALYQENNYRQHQLKQSVVASFLGLSNSQILQEDIPNSASNLVAQVQGQTNRNDVKLNLHSFKSNGRSLHLTKARISQLNSSLSDEETKKLARQEEGDLETHPADFSDIDDSRALDEAADVGNVNNYRSEQQNSSAARGLHLSKSIKSTPVPKDLSSGQGKSRRLTAVIPHQSRQNKQITKENVRTQNKQFGGIFPNAKELSNQKVQHCIESFEQKLVYSDSKQQNLFAANIQPAGKFQQEMVMRLANLNYIQGSIFIMPGFQQLKLIDIRNNRLQDLPSEICMLSQLNTLKVDYNYLVALPFSIGNLTELQHLSASQNRLIELPDSLFRYESKLQILLVNDNKITKIQRSLGSLKHLKQLYLHSNMIIEMPTSFGHLNKLIEFSLDWLAYIEKTQDELEEMQGLKQPSQENKEQMQTTTDQPISARKYFDLNQEDGPNHQNQEESKAQENQRHSIALQKNQSDATVQNRNTAKADIVHENKDSLKGNEAFSLSIIGNRKVLKGEKGALVVKEMRLLCKFIDSAQKNVHVNKQSIVEHGMLHFIQFIMYFQQMSKLTQVKDFVYRHKQRTIVHQMAINGHIYLIQASIAVLGMNRPLTSFNINKTDEDNSTTLVLALRQKRFDFVKYLLRLPQISTTIYSHKHGLPLHVALQQSEFKLALKLLKRKDQLKTPEESVELDVNVPNEQGNTAMHLVFMNFNQNTQKATLTAKMLIKKGATLGAKNKNQMGLLHVAVQAGTINALKFAIEHNDSIRMKNTKKTKAENAQQFNSQERELKLFQFNMKAGSSEWTLLHYAIHATNLQMITFLLECKEDIDLCAQDTMGRRAIDLCPFSSPIFKTIRDQIHRQISNKIQTHAEEKLPNQSESLNIDYSIPIIKRLNKDREVIQNLQVFKENLLTQNTGGPISAKDQTNKLNHKYFSSRECFLQLKNQKVNQNQALLLLQQQMPPTLRIDIKGKGNGPLPKKSHQIDHLTNQNFDSAQTNQTHFTMMMEDVDNYEQNEYSNQQSIKNSPCPYGSNISAALGRVITEDSRQHRIAETATVYGAFGLNINNNNGNFLSTSAIDSADEKCFELYNSQAAAYPYQLLDAQKGNINTRSSYQFDQKDDLQLPPAIRREIVQKEETKHLVFETATFIQNQPLNISSDSAKQGVHDSQVEVQDEGDDEFDLIKNNCSEDEEVNVEIIGNNEFQSDDGENVDDDKEYQGSKAFEARVSQWNRKQSTQYLEEKKIQQQKVKLAQFIVDAFEDVKSNRFKDTDSYGQEIQNLTELQSAKRSQTEFLLIQISSEKSSFEPESIDLNEKEQKNIILQRNSKIEKISQGSNFVERHFAANIIMEQDNENDDEAAQHSDTLLLSTVKINQEHFQKCNQRNQDDSDGINVKQKSNSDSKKQNVKNIWTLKDDYEVYIHAFNLPVQTLRQMMIQFQNHSQIDHIMRKSMLEFAFYEVQQLLLVRQNEMQQQHSMSKLIVINSTGRHRKSPTDYNNENIGQNLLQLTKSVHINYINLSGSPQIQNKNGQNQLNFLLKSSMSNSRESNVNKNMQEVQFQRFEKKNYNEEDSLYQFDSNTQNIFPFQLPYKQSAQSETLTEANGQSNRHRRNFSALTLIKPGLEESNNEKLNAQPQQKLVFQEPKLLQPKKLQEKQQFYQKKLSVSMVESQTNEKTSSMHDEQNNNGFMNELYGRKNMQYAQKQHSPTFLSDKASIENKHTPVSIEQKLKQQSFAINIQRMLPTMKEDKTPELHLNGSNMRYHLDLHFQQNEEATANRVSASRLYKQ